MKKISKTTRIFYAVFMWLVVRDFTTGLQYSLDRSIYGISPRYWREPDFTYPRYALRAIPRLFMRKDSYTFYRGLWK